MNHTSIRLISGNSNFLTYSKFVFQYCRTILNEKRGRESATYKYEISLFGEKTMKLSLVLKFYRVTKVCTEKPHLVNTHSVIHIDIVLYYFTFYSNHS